MKNPFEKILSERAALCSEITRVGGMPRLLKAEEAVLLKSGKLDDATVVNQISAIRVRLELIPSHIEQLDTRLAEIDQALAASRRKSAAELFEKLRKIRAEQLETAKADFMRWGHPDHEAWRLAGDTPAIRRLDSYLHFLGIPNPCADEPTSVEQFLEVLKRVESDDIAKGAAK